METYEGSYVHETDDAILFLPDGWDEDDAVWLAKSQIEYDDSIEYEIDDFLQIDVPDWIADDKGLMF